MCGVCVQQTDMYSNREWKLSQLMDAVLLSLALNPVRNLSDARLKMSHKSSERMVRDSLFTATPIPCKKPLILFLSNHNNLEALLVTLTTLEVTHT